MVRAVPSTYVHAPCARSCREQYVWYVRYPKTYVHVSVQAFMAAAQHSNLIRLYVRLHKTPPAKKPTSVHTSDSRARLLLQVRK